MLQRAETSKHPPQILPTPARPRREVKMPKSSVLDQVVKAAISPIGDEPNLLDLMCYVKDDNDIRSAVALYAAYAASARRLFAAMDETPTGSERAREFLEEEAIRAWSKAYLVADFLKDIQPGWDERHWREIRAETLLAAAFQMGATLPQVREIAAELAAEPIHRDPVDSVTEEFPSDRASSCPVEEIAKQYEQIAATLLGPALEEQTAVTDALEAALLQMADTAADLPPPQTQVGSAFLIMMAVGEIDRIHRGASQEWRDAAAKRLTKLLFNLFGPLEDVAVRTLTQANRYTMANMDPRGTV